MDKLRRDLEKIPGYDRSSPLFEPGTVALTTAAVESLYRNYPVGFLAHAQTFVERHTAADWPDLAAHERERNLSAVENGYEIVGRFALPGGEELLLVTAAEGPGRMRPHTTVDVLSGGERMKLQKVDVRLAAETVAVLAKEAEEFGCSPQALLNAVAGHGLAALAFSPENAFSAHRRREAIADDARRFDEALRTARSDGEARTEP